MSEPKGAPAPYAPLAGENFYLLPSGVPAPIADEVENTFENVPLNTRYTDEVKLIQAALGVEPDGIIGKATRTAARDVAKRYKPEVVQAAFVKLWMEAFNLGTEARDAGLPECVHAVCAYLHNKLCIAYRDLKGEEHLDLDASTKRPVFIRPEPTIDPLDHSRARASGYVICYAGVPAQWRVPEKEMVDLSAALQRVKIERMREALEWLRENIDASRSDRRERIRRGLGQSVEHRSADFFRANLDR